MNAALRYCRTLLTLLLCLGGCQATPQAGKANTLPATPNILFIVADDMGVNDLGVQFGGKPVTPHLDRLAASGVRFQRHYADATCTPSRVGLLTGHHPSELGFSPINIGINPETPTLAKLLRARGYTTHHIGKWHAGDRHPQAWPLQQGYDSFFGFVNQLQLARPDSQYEGGGRKPRYNNPWLQDGNAAPVQYNGHLEDILTEHMTAAISALAQQAKPWLLDAWFFAPHTPIQPAERWAARFPDTPEGHYLALLAQLDENIGLLLQALQDSGQQDRTLVVFISDNGGTNAERNSNYPFSGEKAETREGSLRVPLFMAWPGHIPAGSVYPDITSNPDVFTTLLAAAGVTAPADTHGSNLLDSSHPHTPPRALFWEEDAGNTVLYTALSADGRWRLSNHELFDLQQDPAAQEDVAARHPDIAQAMTEDYIAWNRQAHSVAVDYQRLSARGEAALTGQSFLRAPGFQGFTVSLPFSLDKGHAARTQPLVSQAPLWGIGIDAGGLLQVDVPGLHYSGPPVSAGSCHHLILTSYYSRQSFRPEDESGVIDIYLDGQRLARKRIHAPPLPAEGWLSPTLIGHDDSGNHFEGTIGKPTLVKQMLFGHEDVAPGRQIGSLGEPCARELSPDGATSASASRE